MSHWKILLRRLTVNARFASRLGLTLLSTLATLAVSSTAPAQAAGPWWQISSETTPTNLPPGGEGNLLIVVSNLGDAPIDGSKGPVVIANQLPAGLSATAITAAGKNKTPVECSLVTLECTFSGVLYPYEEIMVNLTVAVNEPPGTTTLKDRVSVSGGGAANASRALSVPVSSEVAGFGTENFELSPFNEDG